MEDAKGDARAPIVKEIKRLEVTIKVMTEQFQSVKEQIQKMTENAAKWGAESVDVEMLRADIKNLDTSLSRFAEERTN